MEHWQKDLEASLCSPARLSERFDVDLSPLESVARRFPMRISPHFLSLLEGPGDPLWSQAVPDLRELEPSDGLADPLGETDLSPVPALIHRYADRVVLLASGACAMYCRFCTRKRQVGTPGMQCDAERLERALAYIEGSPQVRDVVLSGGDPLLLEDDRLEAILKRLHRIAHVEMIRIGTRVPVTLPSRITEALCRMLERYHPLYINTHFNHPRELTSQAALACDRLSRAGIPLGNQTVLLRGVNDCAETMRALNTGLLRMRVRPYYLHQMDLACGTDHFRTPLSTGLRILRSLRGPTSGLAVPHFVVDLPGGQGKVPLIPETCRTLEARTELQSPAGDWIIYPDLPG